MRKIIIFIDELYFFLIFILTVKFSNLNFGGQNLKFEI